MEPKTERELDALRSILIGQELLRSEQWPEEVPSTIDELLEELAAIPAWWGSEMDKPPGSLTPWQVRQIRKRFPESLSGLARVLRLNSFLLMDQIGQGGMGVVYKGWDVEKSRYVAIKRIKTDRRELRKRFRMEARIQRKLRHPNIARFYSVEKVAGSDLLVMEFLNGRTISGEIRHRGRIHWREVARWGELLVDGLIHMHNARILHRDIKPSNVMLHRSPEGLVIKFLDLGLAKNLAGDDASFADASVAQTVMGGIVGTYHYMAPEAWKGAEFITAESDLYSLGSTLFYALAGRTPYDGTTLYQIMQAHLYLPIPSIRTIRPDVPEAIDKLIRTMMSRDPKDRPTGTLLRERFERIRRDPPPSSTRLSTPVAASPPAIPAKKTGNGFADEPSHSPPIRRARLPPIPAPVRQPRPKEPPPAIPDTDATQEARQARFDRQMPVYQLLARWARAVRVDMTSTGTIRDEDGRGMRLSKDDVHRWRTAAFLSSWDWLRSLSKPWRHPVRACVALAVAVSTLRWIFGVRIW